MSYEVGDKVVVKIDGIDANNLNMKSDTEIGFDQFLGKLEDFQPKQEKIKFTPLMKEEFDELKENGVTLFAALNAVRSDTPQALYNWLFDTETFYSDGENQRLFSLAWYKPSLIEVVEIEERHRVGQGNDENRQYLIEGANGNFWFDNEDAYGYDAFLITLDEVKEAEKQLGIQGLQAKWHEASEKEEQK